MFLILNAALFCFACLKNRMWLFFMADSLTVVIHTIYGGATTTTCQEVNVIVSYSWT